MKVLLEYNRKDLRNWAGEDLAKQFFDNRSKYPEPYNNLDYWISKSTPEELAAYMDSYKSKNQQKKEIMQAGAEKVYSDDRWQVIHCTTYDAMKYYGKGTKWCIAGNYPGHEGRGQEYFNDYLRNNYSGYYVFIDNQAPEGNNKWCVCPHQNDINKADIWNAPDYTVEAIPGAPSIKGLPNVSDIIIEDGVLVKVRGRGTNDVFRIPEGIRAVGRLAVADKRYTDCIIPNGVEEIGSGAFAQCNNLSTINIPSSVKKIGTGVFISCDKLEYASLGEGITTLTKNLFFDCRSLTDIVIYGEIESIDITWMDYTDWPLIRADFSNGKNMKLLQWLTEHKQEAQDLNTGEVVNYNDIDKR